MDFLKALEHHIIDQPLHPGISLGPVALPITFHLLLLWLAAALLMIVLPLLARGWPDAPRGPRALLEMFVLFIRDEVVLPSTGPAGLKYLPYFLTLFFFILMLNLFGLVPALGSATGNVSVTASLAVTALGLITLAGVRAHGMGQHLKNFVPHGISPWLMPMIVPLEVLGVFTKTFALAIRLFANMLAGHIMIFSFLSLSFLLADVLPKFGIVSVGVASVIFSVALSMLEVFIAFLQAYIFTFLTATFVGTSLNPH